jgi:hypothetical protein
MFQGLRRLSGAIWRKTWWAKIKALETQLDSLNRQMDHARGANTQMAEHSREAEMRAAWSRLTQQEERERNRNLPGYVALRDDERFH